MINTATTGGYGGFWTAIDAGYFKDEGLDIEIDTIGSTSRAIAALLSNEAQISTLDGQTVVEADTQGADLRVFAAATNHLVFSVMVSPDVKTPADLKGKKMGVTRAGSSTDTAARQALQIWGLKADSDVALVSLDTSPNILGGLVAKQIDAGVLSPPTNTLARNQGFSELLNLAKDGPGFPSIAFGSLHSYAVAHPDIMLAFTRAYSRGVNRFKTDKPFATGVLGKYLKLDDQSVLDDTWEQFRQYLESVPYIPAAGMQNAIEAATATSPGAQGTAPEKYVDNSFVQQLDQGGFFSSLPPVQ